MKQARATDRTHTNADPIHHRLAICLCVVTREHPSANSIFLPFFLVSLLCEIVVAIMMLAGGRCHEFSIGETDNQRIGGSGIICVSFFFRAKMGKSYLLRVCLFTFRFRSQEFFFLFAWILSSRNSILHVQSRCIALASLGNWETVPEPHLHVRDHFIYKLVVKVVL
jgi:hypothetical protein